MAGDEEQSPGGSRIFRHEPSDRELEPSGGDEALIEALSGHLEASFGVEPEVFHELVSDLVHVDVHKVPPADGRNWTTLVTSGMAERPMTVPEGLEDHRFAELVLALPPDWPLSEEAFQDEANYWPIRLLKLLARLPHEFETFLWYGHTVPNGDPPEPYAPSTALCGAIILPPVLVPDGFATLELPDGRTVDFYGVVALHPDEMDYKLDQGAEVLAGHLDDAGVTELVDPGRPSVVPKGRGLFRR
jgi:Suppressor of fused protein (SUFU)